MYKTNNEVVNFLTEESFSAFLNNEILALHISNFISDNLLTAKLSNYLLTHNQRQEYLHEVHYKGGINNKENGGTVLYEEYQVDRVGYPRNKLFVECDDSLEWNKYIKIGESIYNEITGICHPSAHPIELLIQKINNLSTYHASVDVCKGKRLFVGIGRITLPGENSPLELKPHIDTVPVSYGIVKQFAANIYLSMPKTGGEVELWHDSTLSLRESNNQDKNFLSKTFYGDSTIISPKVGDLLLMNTRRPHAVKSFLDGNRTSLHSFLGLTKDNKLKFWS